MVEKRGPSCPYCGAEGVLMTEQVEGKWRVRCTSCGTQGNLVSDRGQAYCFFAPPPRVERGWRR